MIIYWLRSGSWWYRNQHISLETAESQKGRLPEDRMMGNSNIQGSGRERRGIRKAQATIKGIRRKSETRAGLEATRLSIWEEQNIYWGRSWGQPGTKVKDNEKNIMGCWHSFQVESGLKALVGGQGIGKAFVFQGWERWSWCQEKNSLGWQQSEPIYSQRGESRLEIRIPERMSVMDVVGAVTHDMKKHLGRTVSLDGSH